MTLSRLRLVAITIAPSRTMRFDLETVIVHGSDEWYGAREGKTIGSSSAGAVFNGIVDGSARRQLIRTFQGKPKPAPSDYSQSVMNQGHAMEPWLAHELTKWFVVISSNLYRMPELTHGVQEISTPDRIVLLPTERGFRLALAEIKWRPTSPDDCGWGPARDRLSLGVWCQVQHQMEVTGIHAALVYSGSPAGNRRMWSVRYCPEFRPYWLDALKACVDDAQFDSHGHCEVRLGRWMASTSRLEFMAIPRDEDIEEIKGGAVDE